MSDVQLCGVSTDFPAFTTYGRKLESLEVHGLHGRYLVCRIHQGMVTAVPRGTSRRVLHTLHQKLIHTNIVLQIPSFKHRKQYGYVPNCFFACIALVLNCRGQSGTWCQQQRLHNFQVTELDEIL